MQWSTHTSPKRRSRWLTASLTVLVLAPALFLGWAAFATTKEQQLFIWACAGIEAVLLLFLIFRFGSQRVLVSRWLQVVSLLTCVLLRVAFFQPEQATAYVRVGLAILYFVSLVTGRELNNHGGNVRRAKFLLKKLLARETWPAYADYHALPEVQALKQALQDDAGPALTYLAHPDPRVQVAILTALAYQPTWRRGQPEVIFHYTAGSDEPHVRAAGVLALARITKTRHLNVLLSFMHDFHSGVRRAAATAIMHDVENRWPIMRAQIRVALAEPNAAKDGPLPCSNGFPPLALNDLISWSAEAGPIGKRSMATVIRYCKKAITEDATPESLDQVHQLMANDKVPAPIRVEIAHQLNNANAFAPEVAAKLIDASQPTMLRLMAAGALLSQREDKRAIDVLREAARQPNREIAIAAAGIIQRYLGIDMGLPVGSELPALNTRLAAEVSRRVLDWATTEAAIPSSFEDEAPEGFALHSDEF